MTETRSAGPGLLGSWLRLVRRRWRAGLIAFLAIAAVVAFVLITADPVYRADTRLRLGEPPPSTGVSPTSGVFSLLQQLGGDPFANDLELLGSRTVAEQVVEDVALHARLDAPRHWHRDSLFTRFEADRTTRDETWLVEYTGDGVRVTLQSRDSVAGVALPGKPFTFGGVTAEFREWRQGMPRQYRIDTEPFDDVARRLSGRLVVERTRREANVLTIAFEDTDPGVARSAVQSAVGRFMALRTAIQRRESTETVDSLRAVAKETAAELADAEDALESWQRESRLVAPEVQSEAWIERYAGLVTELETARIESAAIDSILDRLAAEPEPSRAWVTLLAYPRFLENETIGGLMSRMSELEELRLELATRRAETSREYGVLREQIDALDATLRRLATGYRTSLGERVADLETLIAGMDAELARLPGDAVELMRRQRNVRLLSELVVLTEQRLRQEELREALTYANVQVIDPPQLRRRQVWPRPKLGAAIGLLLASGFGLLGMVAAERADPSVRSARAIRALTGAPVLATAVRNRGGGTQIALRDLEAVSTVVARRGATSLSLAPTSREDADVLADGIIAAAASAGLSFPDIRTTDGVTVFGAATLAARAPVILVVEHARTRSRELEAAAARVREAGGDLIGTIVVCRAGREARDLWG